MSLELVNTLATLGTFVVIAATAIAAIVQLRHARSSNHIAALNELREARETPHFQTASNFVAGHLSEKLQDPSFRYQLANAGARTDEMLPLTGMLGTLGNHYEAMGVLVKAGLIDRELVQQLFADNITQSWEQLAPVTAIARRRVGPALWENFEYITVLAQDWKAAHAKGTYPTGVRHIELKDQWLEADKRYAASLAT